MEQYTINVDNPIGSWLFSRGIGIGETSYIRCPFCGDVFDFEECASELPGTCPSCKQAVKGEL